MFDQCCLNAGTMMQAVDQQLSKIRLVSRAAKHDVT